MNWAIFTGLYTQINTPLMNSINSVTTNMLSAVSAPLQAALALYVAVIGLSILAGYAGEPLRELWVRMAKAAAIVFFLTAGSYDQYVQNFVLTQLPSDISSAITGGATTISAASFDTIWNKAFTSGLQVEQNLSWMQIGLHMLVLLYWFCAAIACSVGFLVWMAAQILLGLFVCVGPVILPMFLFPAVRSVFERWIGAMMSMLFLQLFVVVLLTVLLGAETTLLANVTAGGDNAYGQVGILMGAVIMFIIVSMILTQLPGAATALAGGMHFHAQAISRAVYGRSIAVSQAAADGGRKLIGRGAGYVVAASKRNNAPPGPSKSSTSGNP